MNSSEKCPICGEGILTQVEDSNEIERDDVKYSLPIFYSVCSVCQIEVATPEQLKLNKKIMVDFNDAYRQTHANTTI